MTTLTSLQAFHLAWLPGYTTKGTAVAEPSGSGRCPFHGEMETSFDVHQAFITVSERWRSLFQHINTQPDEAALVHCSTTH